MDSLYLFLVKNIVVSGVLCAWYALGLRNQKLHNYNRFFLLFALYASIQVPLLHFNFFTIQKANTISATPALFLLHVVTGNSVGAGSVTTQAGFTAWDWDAMFKFGSIVISAVIFLFFSARIIWVMRMYKKFPCSRDKGIVMVNTDLPQAPFSFFNILFWNTAIPVSSENGQLILRHEMAHIRQGHTYDKLACQLLTCLFWFNPFYWFIQKELAIQHEFIADANAVADNDTVTFATMLLQTHNDGKYITAGHSFFSSPIKRRLIMLRTSSITRYATLRRLLVLPLIAGTVLLFSFRAAREHKPAVTKAGKKIVIVVDAGHGGTDAGCQHNGRTEKELNLKIATRIKELSPEYNVEVHLTRSGDDNVTLAGRVAMADKIHPDDLISIHIDDRKDDNPAKGNFDVFVMDNNYLKQSRQLGKFIFENIALIGGIQKQSIRDDRRFYVLRNSKTSAVLLELGDIKDKVQMERLSNDDKLDEICTAILKGVVEAHKG